VTEPSTTERRKTSFSISPAAAKALAKAKYELYSKFDEQVTQSEILDAIILHYTQDIENLYTLVQSSR
jgi:hypothetical protein